MRDSQRSRSWQLPDGWFANTPLSACAQAYIRYLSSRGYAAETIKVYGFGVAQFARWLVRQRLDLTDLDEQLIDRFVYGHLLVCQCKPRCRRTPKEPRAALRHLLKMLRATGQCAPRRSGVPAAIAAELERFDGYLADVRGLSPSTRSVRIRHVRDFLVDRFGDAPMHLSALEPEDVASFVDRYTAGWAPASTRGLGISLRSFFAYRATRGEQTTALAAALPRVAQWRLAGLPPVLSDAEITQLLNSFDRSTATGKRDYAITRCLLDLGLRRSEVAQLTIEDVDWRGGTVHIHAKGKRLDLLPLPAATGRAITAYLRDGRPPTKRRELFVRHRPPANAPAGADIVRNAVRNAARRCGLEHRIRGTHIFRYTLAGRLVRGGARFKEIADLLRHRNLDTTTIYAKVDFPALARVALPWPGRQP